MKFCPECGTRLASAGVKFCGECGASLAGFNAGSTEHAIPEHATLREDVTGAGSDVDDSQDKHPEPYGWGLLVNALTANSGAAWFAEYPIGVAQDALALIPELSKTLSEYEFAQSFEVAHAFGMAGGDPDQWATPVSRYGCSPFQEHVLGGRLLKVLDQAGIVYTVDSDGDQLACVFETGVGPIIEHGHLCVRPDGTAVIQWSSELLACWADRDLGNPTLLYLQSRLVNVPAILQAAFFLGETPYPSTALMLAMPREIALRDAGISEDLFPRPCVQWTTDDSVVVPMLDGDTVTGLATTDAPPWMVRGAYEISGELSDEQLLVCLRFAADAFRRMHEMLSDGLEDGEAQEAAPFSVVLASDAEILDADVFYLPFISLVWMENSDA